MFERFRRDREGGAEGGTEVGGEKERVSVKKAEKRVKHVSKKRVKHVSKKRVKHVRSRSHVSMNYKQLSFSLQGVPGYCTYYAPNIP